MVFLARNGRPGEFQMAADIAREQGLPPNFLAKIFSVLAQRGLVAARRGTNGGYALARKPGRISIADIVDAVDGSIEGCAGECMLGFPSGARGRHCAAHEPLVRVERLVSSLFRKTTLADIL